MYYRNKSKNKYHNKKTYTSDGILHDSRHEAERWSELLLLQRAGKIRDLERQVRFELIPAYFEELYTGEFYQRGAHKGEPKKKRVCVEKSVVYVADFVYTDNNTAEQVVEDAKGERTKEYIIKRKLMLYLKGIRIKEV